MAPSPPYRVAFVAVFAAAIMALWAACGDPTSTGPTPIPHGPPALVCPAGITVTQVQGPGAAVTYVNPVPTGGTPPLTTTTCTPASGGTFPLGATTVGCAVKDAIGRPAVCSFSVTLTAAHLGAMSLMAFGDSQTAGENGDDADPNNLPTHYYPACGLQPSTTMSRRRVQSIRPAFIDSANAYPTQLETSLTDMFVGESFTMDNEGLPDETAASGTLRLASGCPPNGTSIFARDHPDVFLLMEGINDVAAAEEAPVIFGYLESDVAAAATASVPFTFVSTILPVGTCPDIPDQTCRSPSPNTENMAIDAVNALIRGGIPGAVIVDGNKAFLSKDPTLATLIGPDGLHPTAKGYGVLANAFFDAITSHITITSLHRTHR